MFDTQDWPPRRYLNAVEVADYIRSTEASVRQLVHRKQMPSIKRGTRLLFDIQEIDAWLSANSRN